MQLSRVCVCLCVRVCLCQCVCLFVVDSEFEGDASGELVPVTAGGERVGGHFTLHVDVCVQRGVQELHGH